MKNITNIQEFEEMKAEPEYILFKKSPTCMRSISAFKELENAIRELGLQNIYILDVLKTGDLKYEIADYYKIQHESPQVIVNKSGKIDFANHGQITIGWFHNTLNGRHDTR